MVTQTTSKRAEAEALAWSWRRFVPSNPALTPKRHLFTEGKATSLCGYAGQANAEGTSTDTQCARCRQLSTAWALRLQPFEDRR